MGAIPAAMRARAAARGAGGAGGAAATAAAGAHPYAAALAALEAAAAARAPQEPEGPPLLDPADVEVVVRVLRSSLPLPKGSLQRLLLNMGCHAATREALLRMLLSLLRSLPGAAAAGEGGPSASGGGAGDEGGPSGMDVSEDEAPARLRDALALGAAADSAAAGAAAAAGTSAAVQQPAEMEVEGAAAAAAAASTSAAAAPESPRGKPAVVSRRVLDMLSHVTAHNRPLARQLLSLRVPADAAGATEAAARDDKGKAPAKRRRKSAPGDAAADAAAAQQQALAAGRAAAGSGGGAGGDPRALEVLLGMLGSPLAARSLALLEALLALLEQLMAAVYRLEQVGDLAVGCVVDVSSCGCAIRV